MDRRYNWLKAANFYLALIVAFSLALLLISHLHQRLDRDELWSNVHEFGMHLLVAMIEVLITINLVERIIRRNELVKHLPFRAAIYEDICAWTNLMISSWFSMYEHGVEPRTFESPQEFFQEEVFLKLFKYLDINAAAPTDPVMPVHEWVRRMGEEIIANGSKITDRYSGHMDPGIHLIVSRTVGSRMLKGILFVNKVSDHCKKFGDPRPTILMTHSTGPDERSLKLLRELANWCSEEHAHLSKLIRNLEVPTTRLSRRSTKAATCRIDEKSLQQQVENFRNHALGKENPFASIPVSDGPPTDVA